MSVTYGDIDLDAETVWVRMSDRAMTALAADTSTFVQALQRVNETIAQAGANASKVLAPRSMVVSQKPVPVQGIYDLALVDRFERILRETDVMRDPLEANWEWVIGLPVAQGLSMVPPDRWDTPMTVFGIPVLVDDEAGDSIMLVAD